MKLLVSAIFTAFVVSFFLGFSPGAAQQSQGHASPLPLVTTDRVVNSSSEELRVEAEMLSGGAGCNSTVWTGKHATVGEIVGGKVIRVRAARFAPFVTTEKADQIPTILRQVWERRAEQPVCYIPWDEGASWSIEAILEFEDGKRSILVTDGFHVAVQDHEGHSNFMRIVTEDQ
jgi:hypothetical protein